MSGAGGCGAGGLEKWESVSGVLDESVAWVGERGAWRGVAMKKGKRCSDGRGA